MAGAWGSGHFRFRVAREPYWQPVKVILGVRGTLVNGPVPVRARGGLEFTSEAVQVLVVIPSTV